MLPPVPAAWRLPAADLQLAAQAPGTAPAACAGPTAHLVLVPAADNCAAATALLPAQAHPKRCPAVAAAAAAAAAAALAAAAGVAAVPLAAAAAALLVLRHSLPAGAPAAPAAVAGGAAVAAAAPASVRPSAAAASLHREEPTGSANTLKLPAGEPAHGARGQHMRTPLPSANRQLDPPAGVVWRCRSGSRGSSPSESPAQPASSAQSCCDSPCSSSSSSSSSSSLFLPPPPPPPPPWATRRCRRCCCRCCTPRVGEGGAKWPGILHCCRRAASSSAVARPYSCSAAPSPVTCSSRVAAAALLPAGGRPCCRCC